MTGRPIRVLALSAASLVFLLWSGGGASAASPDPHGLWHAPIIVTHDVAEANGDAAYVTAISCPAAGDCSAVGRYTGTLVKGGPRLYEGYVANETNGTWHSASLVTSDSEDLYDFTAISCASAGNCVAVGDSINNQVFALDETNGSWGSPQIVAGSESVGGVLTSVSCPAAGECTAAGTLGGQAFVVSQSDGTWGAPDVLPGSLNVDAGLTAISCVSAGSCTVGGYYDAQPYGPLPGVGYVLVGDESNGSWGSVQSLGGSFAANGDIDVDTVTSVSCSSAGTCSAAGYYGTYGGLTHAFVASESNKTWGSTVDVADSLGVSGAQLASISCPSNGNCSAAGFYADRNANPHDLVVNETGGAWKPAQQVAGSLNVGEYGELDSVSCSSAGNCSAGGEYANSAGGFVGLVVTETDGTWGAGEGVANPAVKDGLAQVNSISCPSIGACAAGGVIKDTTDVQQAFVVDETPATVPSPPTHVMAKAGNKRAAVSWTAPGSNGGSAITGYTVTSKPGGKTCTTTKTSCTVKGLTNGKHYTFSVVATNALGHSTPAVSKAAVPKLPGAPKITKTSHTKTSLTLKWTPPPSDGGAAITGYDVYVGTKAGTQPTKLANHELLSASKRSDTVKHLKSSTRYYLVVRAKNRLGLGAQSKRVSVLT